MGFYLNKYIELVKNADFNQIPFTEIDGVIFSMISLIDVEKSIPKIKDKKTASFSEVIDAHVKEHGLKQLGLIISATLIKMLHQASKANRYKDLQIGNLYEDVDLNRETQTTCFTITLSDKVTIVVFGGTDDTIIGWKEDFNLLINKNIPCLTNSVEYLNKIGRKSKKLILVGHSKGGMESLYASAFCKDNIKKKIISAYSFDGPGYGEEIIETKEFKDSMDKMHLICPNGGCVGRILNNPVKPDIIFSRFLGLNQHDPMSWEIDGTIFLRMEKFTPESDALKDKLDSIFKNTSEEDSNNFLNSLFKVVFAGGSLTLSDIGKNPRKALIEYLSLPKEKKKMVTSLFNKLMEDKVVAKELFLGMVTRSQMK